MSYNPALIICAGTAACAGGVVVERRRRAEVERVTRRLAATRDDRGDQDQVGVADRRRLEHLRDNVRVIGFDVDASGGYSVHPALSGEPDHWAPGAFHHMGLPGPNLRAQQISGRLEGYSPLNPHALDGIDGLENAAGGVRNLGWLASFTGQKDIVDAIRGALNLFSRRTRDLYREGETVRIRIIAGSFGGFGSGALELLERTTLACAGDMFADANAWDLRTALLVPGRHRGKDADNTRAVTCAVVMEKAAQATGWLHRVVQSAGEARIERARPVPVTLMSDENAAGTPAVLSLHSFTGAVAEYVWAEVATPAGEKLIARGSDLDTAGAELTDLGEPLRARSAGVSAVELPLVRIGRYCEARLGAAVLEHLLHEVDEDQIDELSKSIFVAERLLEGDGFNDLSQRLLRGGPADPGLEAVLVQRFRRSTADLAGLDLLAEAGDRMDLVVRQLNAGATVAREADRVIGVLDVRMAGEVRRLFRDPRAGAAAARQYLENTAARAGHVAEKAAADTTDREDHLREAEARVAHYEEKFTPGVRQMNRVVRWVKRDQIDTAADRYRRALEHRGIARLHLLANQAAVRVLEATRESAERLLQRVTQAVDTLTEIRAALEDEQRRLAELPKGTTCPVGLSLAQGEEDLDAYYQRFLTERGEAGALGDVAARLLNEEDPVASATDRFGVERLLSEYVASTFRVSLSELHVVDELLRRFPTPADLAEVLRERADREAAERLPLKDGTSHIYRERRVAVVGLDRARSARIVEMLETRPNAENVPFEVVDTADRERIVFLRLRGAFPASAWSHIDGFKESYDRVTIESPFERLHVYAGDRFLPWPGRPMSELEAQLVVLRAWTLGRLEMDPSTGELVLVRGDGDLRLGSAGRLGFVAQTASLQRVALGTGLATLTRPQDNGRKAYALAVDVTSLLGCAIQFFGTDPLDAAVAAVAPGASGPRDALEAAVAQVVTDAATRAFRSELEHWRHNTSPALLGHSRGQRLLRGVA